VRNAILKGERQPRPAAKRPARRPPIPAGA
jgi:hypothetical protein